MLKPKVNIKVHWKYWDIGNAAGTLTISTALTQGHKYADDRKRYGEKTEA